jgi:DNA (cytosine-5)-methyltransferase 1
MQVLSLFSGIGGFDLGLEQAGMTTIAFCEIEPFCQAILAKHWPDTKIHTDINELDGADYAGAVDLVCGGAPCQPFSVAGRQRGEEDERHLWPQMLRVIRGIRPRWIIFENVGGHVELGTDTVVSQLEADNYACWPVVIPASAVAAPHRRDRLWIIAHAAGVRLERRLPELRQRNVETLPCEAFWASVPESYVVRSLNGIPDGFHRIKALGNAIVPAIAELIGRTIIQYEQQLAA